MKPVPSPPDAHCAQASVVISASVEKVWEALLDFPSYAEWNPFIPSQVLVDADGKHLPSQTPTEGVRIAQETHLPSLPSSHDHFQSSINRTVQVLTHVNPRSHILAWRLASPAHWLFWSERWHALRIRDPSEQERECKKVPVDFWRGCERAKCRGEEAVYVTWEVFGGVIAPAVGWFVHARLQRGLEESAYALKARVEKPRDWSWG